MAATLGTTMAMLHHRCFAIKSSKNMSTYKPTMKPISLLTLKDIPKSFTPFKSPINSKCSTLITSTIVSTLISCGPAFSAQQIAEIAEGDNRALALLLPIIPAILWVLYNILGPALNQINRMRSEKSK